MLPLQYAGEPRRVTRQVQNHDALLIVGANATTRQALVCGLHSYDFFIDFLDELLSDRNFLMDKTIGDNRVAGPDWSLCMGYELELLREAIKYTRERGMAIQEALWAAYGK